MRKLPVLLLALALQGCGMFYTLDTPEAKAAKPLELSAWLVAWDPESIKSFEANAGALARVYPEYITCGADGLPAKLESIPAGWLKHVVEVAHAHGAKVLITMNNYADGGFAADRVRKFLLDTQLMGRHVEALIRIAKAEGVDGLDVDYESLEAGDRARFTAFVEFLGLRCRAEGLLLGIAVHPKEAEPGNWGGPAAQDYSAIGKQVDYFHVMTYDYHWATSDAGTVAPPLWVRSVMNFTMTAVPKAKVEMGLNSYGYDWVGKKGETLTWAGLQKLVAAGQRPERDANTQELKLGYASHEAWYPDARAFVPKIKIAKELGLRGGAMWVLGQEDPAFWRMWAAQK